MRRVVSEVEKKRLVVILQRLINVFESYIREVLRGVKVSAGPVGVFQCRIVVVPGNQQLSVTINVTARKHFPVTVNVSPDHC